MEGRDPREHQCMVIEIRAIYTEEQIISMQCSAADTYPTTETQMS